MALALLSSCNSISPSISLDQTYATFPYTGGTVKASVRCNCDWTASCDVENIMIAPTEYSGDCKVSVTVPPQDSKETIPVRVTFKATSGESTASTNFVVTVQAKPYIEIPEAASTIYVSEKACGVRLTLESNAEWEYVENSGNKTLTIAPKSGKFNDIVSVNFPASTVTRNKTFNLTFRLKEDNSTKVSVKFIQYGKK